MSELEKYYNYCAISGKDPNEYSFWDYYIDSLWQRKPDIFFTPNGYVQQVPQPLHNGADDWIKF